LDAAGGVRGVGAFATGASNNWGQV